jgi:hypothetical protein
MVHFMSHKHALLNVNCGGSIVAMVVAALLQRRHC